MGDTTEHDEKSERASGRDKATEAEPTEAGHSTATTQTERNAEDESPS